MFDIATFPSGLPAGSIVHEFDVNIHRQWFTADNARLFDFGDNRVTITRPIPAGGYEVESHFQRVEWVPCGYVPPPTIWRYNFDSAADTLHEAFFDPVALGDAVGADGTSGVLKPASFAFDGVDAAIRRIIWNEGQVWMALSPHTTLPNHHIDFIALDGSVSLRLDFDNTIESVDKDDEVAILFWDVCVQPWQDGDLLMLRIAEGTQDDGVQATNDPECLTAVPEPADAPQPEPTPDPTETPTTVPTPTEPPPAETSTPTGTPAPQPTPTAVPTATPKVEETVTPVATVTPALAATETVEQTAAPSAPQNLTAVLNGEGTVTLNWDASGDDSITGYQILRRRPTEGEDTLLVYVKDTGGTETTYTDAEVNTGIEYVYRVKAISDTGLSEWSNEVSIGP